MRWADNSARLVVALGAAREIAVYRVFEEKACSSLCACARVHMCACAYARAYVLVCAGPTAHGACAYLYPCA